MFHFLCNFRGQRRKLRKNKGGRREKEIRRIKKIRRIKTIRMRRRGRRRRRRTKRGRREKEKKVEAKSTLIRDGAKKKVPKSIFFADLKKVKSIVWRRAALL